MTISSRMAAAEQGVMRPPFPKIDRHQARPDSAIGTAPAWNLVTVRNQRWSAPVRMEPPFGADVGWGPIKTLAAQIEMICVRGRHC
jgi:hypothetical protein